MEDLLKLGNVVLVYRGHKIKDGNDTGEECICVGVVRKLPENRLREKDIVPKTYNGLKTDVIEVGEIVFQDSVLRTDDSKPKTDLKTDNPISKTESTITRYRPFPCGVSGSNLSVERGTFGAFVRDDEGIYVLSCNHVLSCDVTKPVEEQKCREIIQPSLADSVHPNDDVVGELCRSIPFKENSPNDVDAAVFKVDEDLTDQRILNIGLPCGILREYPLNLEVMKCGRTSCVTRGRLIGTDAIVKIKLGTVYYLFRDQLVFSNMSDSGDSGSLILDNKKRAVALLIAGSSRITIGTPITKVLRALNIELVCQQEDRLTRKVDIALEPLSFIIEGRVTDESTGKALSDVTVRLRDTGLFSLSNESGYYRLEIGSKDLQHSKSLVFEKDGYRLKEVDLKCRSSTNYIRAGKSGTQSRWNLTGSVPKLLRRLFRRDSRDGATRS